jgi:competence protein ComEA
MATDSEAAESPSKSSRIWAFVIIFLLLVTGVSAAVALAKYRPATPVEIRLPPPPSLSGNVSIGGAVANPGIYPFSADDTLASLVQSAGGATANADQTALSLNVPVKGSLPGAQKVNINRADAWLLEALPGIGQTRAKTIVAYREANGPFKSTADVMKVSGIGQSVFDQIKDLITVTD